MIIRAGYGRYIFQKDSRFEENYRKARSAGLHIGAYWYGYAADVNGAKKEAQTFLKVIAGKKFDLPVYYDAEESKLFRTGKANVSAVVTAFIREMEKNGYFAGLYMSRWYLMNYTTDEVQRSFALWVAEYDSECNYKGAGRTGIWQFSSKQRIPGINGDADGDVIYIDYPSIIKGKHFNGF